MARVLAVELASAVEAKVAAHAVGEGRGALAAGLGGEERRATLLAGEADVGRRARVTCRSPWLLSTKHEYPATRLGKQPSTLLPVRRHAPAARRPPSASHPPPAPDTCGGARMGKKWDDGKVGQERARWARARGESEGGRDR